jgi:hypothetical protein
MLVNPIASSDKAESFRFFFCLETFTELGQLMIMILVTIPSDASVGKQTPSFSS